MKEVIFKNGWYVQVTKGGYALYRADGSLIADQLLSCCVYGNGWYELKRKSGYALYRADESLVADNLKYCCVCINGDYLLQKKFGKIKRYHADGSECS